MHVQLVDAVDGEYFFMMSDRKEILLYYVMTGLSRQK